MLLRVLLSPEDSNRVFVRINSKEYYRICFFRKLTTVWGVKLTVEFQYLICLSSNFHKCISVDWTRNKKNVLVEWDFGHKIILISFKGVLIVWFNVLTGYEGVQYDLYWLSFNELETSELSDLQYVQLRAVCRG